MWSFDWLNNGCVAIFNYTFHIRSFFLHLFRSQFWIGAFCKPLQMTLFQFRNFFSVFNSLNSSFCALQRNWKTFNSLFRRRDKHTNTVRWSRATSVERRIHKYIGNSIRFEREELSWSSYSNTLESQVQRIELNRLWNKSIKLLVLFAVWYVNRRGAQE